MCRSAIGYEPRFPLEEAWRRYCSGCTGSANFLECGDPGSCRTAFKARRCPRTQSYPSRNFVGRSDLRRKAPVHRTISAVCSRTSRCNESGGSGCEPPWYPRSDAERPSTFPFALGHAHTAQSTPSSCALIPSSLSCMSRALWQRIGRRKRFAFAFCYQPAVGGNFRLRRSVCRVAMQIASVFDRNFDHVELSTSSVCCHVERSRDISNYSLMVSEDPRLRSE